MRDILSIYLDRIEHLEERLAEARALNERLGNIAVDYEHAIDKYKRLCEQMRGALTVTTESIDDLLFHGCLWPNGVQHEADPDIAKEALEKGKEALAAYEEAVK